MEEELEEGKKKEKKSKKVKKKEDVLGEIKKNLKSKKIMIGTDKTIKGIKLGIVKKVFLSVNCPEKIKRDIKYYSRISEFEIIELSQRNDELGDILKKPFSISVLGITK